MHLCCSFNTKARLSGIRWSLKETRTNSDNSYRSFFLCKTSSWIPQKVINPSIRVCFSYRFHNAYRIQTPNCVVPSNGLPSTITIHYFTRNVPLKGFAPSHILPALLSCEKPLHPTEKHTGGWKDVGENEKLPLGAFPHNTSMFSVNCMPDYLLYADASWLQVVSTLNWKLVFWCFVRAAVLFKGYWYKQFVFS